ncbi:MAG: hypothetical protein LBG05_08930 [Treponema sp.]|nr:hypothetical protein [Treponema sp.]
MLRRLTAGGCAGLSQGAAKPYRRVLRRLTVSDTIGDMGLYGENQLSQSGKFIRSILRNETKIK